MACARRPCSGRAMTSAAHGWVAGILEGEGSFMSLKRHAGRNDVLRVSMQSTDKDVLDRLHEVTGVGSVNLVGDRPRRKRCWQWAVSRHNDCLWLMRTVYPHMCDRRREQIAVALATVGDQP